MKNIEEKKTIRNYELRITRNSKKNSRLSPVSLINLTKIMVLTFFCGLGGFSSFAQPTFVGSGGNGTHYNPYLISTPNDLVELSQYISDDTVNTHPMGYGSVTALNNYGKYFRMTNDIDMANVLDFFPIGGRGWYSLGVFSSFISVFCGNFDGGGFAIKNLTMNWALNNNPNNQPQIGLFGVVIDASISNLTLDSASYSSIEVGIVLFVASAMGYNKPVRIENCIVKNSVAISPSVIGFVVVRGSAIINNCHVIDTYMEGYVIGFCTRVDAKSASCTEDGVLKSCFIDSLVITNSSVTSSTLNGTNGGGAVGFINDVISANTRVSNCCVSNCVISGERSVSGFASSVAPLMAARGGRHPRIENCYVQASLYITAAKQIIPILDIPDFGYGAYGFILSLRPNTLYPDIPIIFNCYAACEIHGFDTNYSDHSSFGVIRRYQANDIMDGTNLVNTFANCYYLTQPPISAFKWSPHPNGVTGKSQTELRDTNMVDYPSIAGNSLNAYQVSMPWKSDIYNINKGYPILSWQYQVVPSVAITLPATDITKTSATLNGIVIANDDTVLIRGFLWRQVGTNNWAITIVSGTTDTISSTLTGLILNTLYEFKTFITTPSITRYGDTLFFTLEESIVITLEATDITQNSATLNGIVLENDEPVLERGFQWRKTGDSAWITTTVSDITDTISAVLTGLIPNTSYEFKAYLTTTDTIKYGDTLSFSTLEEQPSTVTTLLVANITETSALLNGRVVEKDEVVVERGFEWREFGSDNWTIVSAEGTNNISYQLTELTPKTQYEYAAYIKTSIVKYGEILTFVTLKDLNITNYLSKTSGISIYPNPTTGKLTIDNGELIIENVEIYDVFGRKQEIIVNYQLSTINSIDVSHLPAGMYYLKVGNQTARFVKK